MANDKAVSEPVRLADRRGKSASRSVKVSWFILAKYKSNLLLEAENNSLLR